MRTVIHLRHAERATDGIHLSDRGRSQAADIARSVPRFDRVVTSPKPRAVETAEAMGQPPNGRLPILGEIPTAVLRTIDRDPPGSFADYLALGSRNAAARTYAAAAAEAIAREIDRVPDPGRLLVVSHAGVVELSAVGAIGPAAADWGPTVSPLEGVELVYDQHRWQHGTVVRRPP